MKLTMTQNFINTYLNYDDDFTLIEISKEQFDELYKDKKRTEYFYEQDIYYNIDNIAHPLLKVHIIKDLRYSYPSGSYDWEFIFIFKYKGKYYMFIDAGGT